MTDTVQFAQAGEAVLALGIDGGNARGVYRPPGDDEDEADFGVVPLGKREGELVEGTGGQAFLRPVDVIGKDSCRRQPQDRQRQCRGECPAECPASHDRHSVRTLVTWGYLGLPGGPALCPWSHPPSMHPGAIWPRGRDRSISAAGEDPKRASSAAFHDARRRGRESA